MKYTFAGCHYNYYLALGFDYTVGTVANEMWHSHVRARNGQKKYELEWAYRRVRHVGTWYTHDKGAQNHYNIMFDIEHIIFTALQLQSAYILNMAQPALIYLFKLPMPNEKHLFLVIHKYKYTLCFYTYIYVLYINI